MSHNKNIIKLLTDSYRYIERNYSENLNLSDIASKTFLSEFHFHRLFKAQFQISPKEFLTQIRNEKAVHLLLNTNFSIGDISMEVGFENPETMIRSFKKQYGITPGEYRKKKSKKEPYVPNYKPRSIDTKILTFPEKHLICMRFEGDISKMGAALRRFLDYTLQKGIYRGKPFIGQFLDHPKLEDTKLRRINFGLEIESNFMNKIEFPLFYNKIPAGKYLRAMHKGDPKELEETYNSLYSNILQKKGIHLAKENPFEIYHKISPFYPIQASEIEILILLEK